MKDDVSVVVKQGCFPLGCVMDTGKALLHNCSYDGPELESCHIKNGTEIIVIRNTTKKLLLYPIINLLQDKNAMF